MWKRITYLAGLTALFVLGVMPMAFATAPADVSDTLGDAAETVYGELMETAVAVLPYAALLLSLFIGWRIVRRFTKTS
jgi:hypothetical protein